MAATTGSPVELAGLTDLGLKRRNNEDSFAAFQIGSVAPGAPLTYCLAVADGMGGMERGEVASAAAIAAVQQELPRLLGSAPPGSDLSRTLEIVVTAADEAAFRATSSSGLSGTTLVIALIMGDRAYISSVGDSRAYLVSHGELLRLTSDHTISPESNVLTQALGTGRPIAPCTTSVRLSPGDTILLASDGLTYYVKDEDIRAFVTHSNWDLNSLCRNLVESAKTGGGHDNITVVAARTTSDRRVSVGGSSSQMGFVRRWETYGLLASLVLIGVLMRQLAGPPIQIPPPITGYLEHASLADIPVGSTYPITLKSPRLDIDAKVPITRTNAQWKAYFRITRLAKKGNEQYRFQFGCNIPGVKVKFPEWNGTELEIKLDQGSYKSKEYDLNRARTKLPLYIEVPGVEGKLELFPGSRGANLDNASERKAAGMWQAIVSRVASNVVTSGIEHQLPGANTKRKVTRRPRTPNTVAVEAKPAKTTSRQLSAQVKGPGCSATPPTAPVNEAPILRTNAEDSQAVEPDRTTDTSLLNPSATSNLNGSSGSGPEGIHPPTSNESTDKQESGDSTSDPGRQLRTRLHTNADYQGIA